MLTSECDNHGGAEPTGDLKSIAQHYNLLRKNEGPIGCMPPEILSQIFRFTLLSDSEAAARRRFDVQASPWLLGHICSRWRTVALATPSLWSLVSIDYNTDNPTSAYPLPMLELQLQRASRLRVHFCPNTSHPRHQAALLKCLIEHSSRWVDLSLVIIPEMLPLLASIRGRVPALRRLWMEWAEKNPHSDSDSNSDSDSDTSDGDDVEFFDDAPSLRQVGLLVQYRRLSVPIPMDQLTRYELNGLWKTHVQNLQFAANLVEAHIFVDDALTPRTVSGGEIELPNIRRLYVSDADILECLRCPTLEDLSFDLNGDERPEHHLDSILLRSGCTLRSLCLVGMPVAATITAILRNNSSLDEFAIVLTGQASSQEMDAVTSNLTSVPHVSPQLSGIFFGCLDETSFDYSLYADMLESRWKSDGPLQRSALLINSESGPAAEVLSRLDSLRGEGLDFVWMKGPQAVAATRAWYFCMQWDIEWD